MTQVQRFASWSFFFSLLLALWAMIDPVPYALCMATLLLTPLIAIAAIGLSKGRLAVFGDGKQFTLLFVFIYSMTALADRAYHDVQILSNGKSVLYAFLVAVVMVFILAAVDGRLRNVWVVAILIPVVTFSYGIGVVLECDMLLDRSHPQRYITRVLHRDIHWGSRRKSYTVTLAPWAGHTEPLTDLVTRAVYYSLNPGADACVSMAPGALRIPWYKLEACHSDSATAASR